MSIFPVFPCSISTTSSTAEHTSTSDAYQHEATCSLINSVSPTPPGDCVSDARGLYLSVGTVAAISCLVTFAVTFVLGFSLGVLVQAVVVKQCRGRSKSASGATPSGPVYEVVDSREENKSARQQKIELKENVAYGPVGELGKCK